MNREEINQKISELQQMINKLEDSNYKIQIEKDSILNIESDSSRINNESTNLISLISSAIVTDGTSGGFDDELVDMESDYNRKTDEIINLYDNQITYNLKKIEFYNREISSLRNQLLSQFI